MEKDYRNRSLALLKAGLSIPDQHAFLVGTGQVLLGCVPPENQEGATHKEDLEKQLTEVNSTFRSFLFKKGIKEGKVVDLYSFAIRCYMLYEYTSIREDITRGHMFYQRMTAIMITMHGAWQSAEEEDGGHRPGG